MRIPNAFINELSKLPLIRLVVVMCILLAGIGLAYVGSSSTRDKLRETVTLESFPKQIGLWNYSDANTFSADIIEMLGTDTYIDYYYRSQNNREIEVLVSYYSSMHEGKQFHSPKNCMLGSGWETLESRLLVIKWHGRSVPVNYILVRKDTQILNVAYWVQGRGRLMASEYDERIFRVVDSFVKRRTDGAFIRVSLPGYMKDRAQDLKLLQTFVESLAIEVDTYLPK